MSDLFHGRSRRLHRVGVLDHASAPQHTFQILTKRPERMRDFMVRWADRLDRDASGEPEHRMALARGPEQLRTAHDAGRALLMADMLEQWGNPPEGAAHPTYDWMEGPITWPDVPPNVWLGVSIENRKWVGRADVLRETPAAVRFISAEPLLGDLTDQTLCPLCGGTGCWDCGQRGMVHGPDALDLAGIDWLILGGESGSGHRPLDVQWMRDLRDAAQATRKPCDWCGQSGIDRGEAYRPCPRCDGTAYVGGTALFVKQFGGHRPGTALEDLPEDLRIREFPAVPS